MVSNLLIWSKLEVISETFSGAGKAAVDKMAVDCAKDLRKDGVTMVSQQWLL